MTIVCVKPFVYTIVYVSTFRIRNYGKRTGKNKLNKSVVKMVGMARESGEANLSYGGEILQCEWIPANASLLKLKSIKLVDMEMIYRTTPLISTTTSDQYHNSSKHQHVTE
jgi:hypothetical protein